MRRNQLLAGFMRGYKSTVTGGSFMEAMGEGFLNLVRDRRAAVRPPSPAGADGRRDQAHDLRCAARLSTTYKRRRIPRRVRDEQPGTGVERLHLRLEGQAHPTYARATSGTCSTTKRTALPSRNGF